MLGACGGDEIDAEILTTYVLYYNNLTFSCGVYSYLVRIIGTIFVVPALVLLNVCVDIWKCVDSAFDVIFFSVLSYTLK